MTSGKSDIAMNLKINFLGFQDFSALLMILTGVHYFQKTMKKNSQISTIRIKQKQY